MVRENHPPVFCLINRINKKAEALALKDVSDIGLEQKKKKCDTTNLQSE